ncbi:MAG: cytochrome c [Candidatus Brocadiaceae bacterium]|nr:cytochrome c [Candidatus Brocadiaceae bacterium]
MRRPFVLRIRLLSFFGLIGILCFACSYHTFAAAGQEGTGQIVAHEQEHGAHAGMDVATRKFMGELEHCVNNLLNGILEGNFDHIQDEADHIARKANSLSWSFFENANRFRAVEANRERSKQKDIFSNYVDGVNKQIGALKKAAASQDTNQTLAAFNELLKSSCIDCHTKYRK